MTDVREWKFQAPDEQDRMVVMRGEYDGEIVTVVAHRIIGHAASQANGRRWRSVYHDYLVRLPDGGEVVMPQNHLAPADDDTDDDTDDDDLAEDYRQMAQDEASEADALEWIEAQPDDALDQTDD